jgi:hypothetical protein
MLCQIFQARRSEGWALQVDRTAIHPAQLVDWHQVLRPTVSAQMYVQPEFFTIEPDDELFMVDIIVFRDG